jgi:hypothetical protein
MGVRCRLWPRAWRDRPAGEPVRAGLDGVSGLLQELAEVADTSVDCLGLTLNMAATAVCGKARCLCRIVARSRSARVRMGRRSVPGWSAAGGRGAVRSYTRKEWPCPRFPQEVVGAGGYRLARGPPFEAVRVVAVQLSSSAQLNSSQQLRLHCGDTCCAPTGRARIGRYPFANGADAPSGVLAR